jgi:[acyl-carrier-protein] S-malonyltransferase
VYSDLVEWVGLSFDVSLRLVKLLCEMMAASGARQPGTMAAVLGFNRVELDALCRAAAHVVAVANYNSADQVVISGTPEGVAEVSEKAKEMGAKRVIPLNVSGAFHSPLMTEPAKAFRPVLAQATYHAPRIAVYANLEATPYQAAGEVPERLAAQLDHPVLWEDTIKAMAAAGVTTYVEVGAGRVLSGLAKKIHKEAQTFNVEDVASLEKTLAGLGLEVNS